MRRKFARCDADGDGLIDRAQFGAIIAALDLALSPAMQRQYVDVNFRFVDRALRGRISFGQFLACYANFLYSYEISQVRSPLISEGALPNVRRVLARGERLMTAHVKLRLRVRDLGLSVRVRDCPICWCLPLCSGRYRGGVCRVCAAGGGCSRWPAPPS